MQTNRTQIGNRPPSIGWWRAVFLLSGCPILASAGGGYELASGRIAVISSFGGDGDGGYKLSHGSISSVPSDSISPAARMAACMSWSHAAIPAVCEGADLDGDGNVDLFDFAEFQNGFTNP